MIIPFLTDFPELIAGTTTDQWGDCSKRSPENPYSHILECHQRLLGLCDFTKVYTPYITHSNIVCNIANDDLNKETDALITNKPKLFIAVPTADCIPVFLYAPDKKAIGIAHSGRIGLRDHITENTIIKMKADFDININKLIVQIGPHICASCYEVGKDILEEFGIEISEEKGFLPMQDILIQNLLTVGLKPHQIRSTKLCTLCSSQGNEHFFSYRNQGDMRRILSFIGLRS